MVRELTARAFAYATKHLMTRLAERGAETPSVVFEFSVCFAVDLSFGLDQRHSPVDTFFCHHYGSIEWHQEPIMGFLAKDRVLTWLVREGALDHAFALLCKVETILYPANETDHVGSLSPAL